MSLFSNAQQKQRISSGGSIDRLSKINFKFDDQMWLSESGVMVNHAKFSKFGIHLGDVVVSFSKQ